MWSIVTITEGLISRSDGKVAEDKYVDPNSDALIAIMILYIEAGKVGSALKK
jgi:hypothetical protein